MKISTKEVEETISTTYGKVLPFKMKITFSLFTLPPSKVKFLSFLVTSVCGPSRIGRDSIFEFCFQYFLCAFFIFFFSSLPSKVFLIHQQFSGFVDHLPLWIILFNELLLANKKNIVKLCNFLLILFILFKLIFLSDLSLAQMYNHFFLQWWTAAEA